MIRISALLGLGLSAFAGAAIFETQGNPVKTITSGTQSVPVYRDGTLRVGGQTFTMHLTGAGLRKKKLGFVNVDVYVAASYVDLSTGISPADPITSVKASDARVMKLTLTRDLSASQIKTGFEDCLVANGADLKEPNLKGILDQLTFDMPKGAEVLISSYRKVSGSKDEFLYIEMPAKDITGGGPELGVTFWRNWFGIPADDGLKVLKAALVGVVP